MHATQQIVVFRWHMENKIVAQIRVCNSLYIFEEYLSFYKRRKQIHDKIASFSQINNSFRRD